MLNSLAAEARTCDHHTPFACCILGPVTYLIVPQHNVVHGVASMVVAGMLRTMSCLHLADHERKHKSIATSNSAFFCGSGYTV